VPQLQQAWTHLSFVVDTNWTDSEAESHGWAQGVVGGTGTMSWSQVMHNLHSQELFYHVNSTTGATVVNGIDNVSLASVPEPSTLVLMVLGGLSLVGYRLIRRGGMLSSS